MQILSDFQLHRPATVDDAVQLRGELGESAALYAGGTELLLAMKMGVLDYEHLIDVKRIDGLRGIEVRDGALWIGAATTHREIETSPVVQERLPALATPRAARGERAGARRGDAGRQPRVRRAARGPAALLTALGATVELVGSGGRRSVGIEEFRLGAYETELVRTS